MKCDFCGGPGATDCGSMMFQCERCTASAPKQAGYGELVALLKHCKMYTIDKKGYCQS